MRRRRWTVLFPFRGSLDLLRSDPIGAGQGKRSRLCAGPVFTAAVATLLALAALSSQLAAGRAAMLAFALAWLTEHSPPGSPVSRPGAAILRDAWDLKAMLREEKTAKPLPAAPANRSRAPRSAHSED